MATKPTLAASNPVAFDPAELRVVRGTVRGQSYDKLRRAIVSGYFLPGQRLIERELCEIVGVSRTSIREALRTLEGEKLIVTIPNRGPCVATLSLDEASEIYEVRRVLEGLAGQRAAQHATDAEIATLATQVDAFDAAVEREDLHRLVEIAAEFYETLLLACRNELVRTMLDSLNARISLLRATSMSNPKRSIHSAAEMRAIVDAIRDRDPMAAMDACAIHVRNATAAARQTLLLQQQAEEARTATGGKARKRVGS